MIIKQKTPKLSWELQLQREMPFCDRSKVDNELNLIKMSVLRAG